MENGFGVFFQAEDGIRDGRVTGVQTCALPISVNRFISHRRRSPTARLIGSRSAPCSRIYSPDDQIPLRREHPRRSRSLLESHLSIPRPSGLAASPAPPRKPSQNKIG